MTSPLTFLGTNSLNYYRLAQRSAWHAHGGRRPAKVAHPLALGVTGASAWPSPPRHRALPLRLPRLLMVKFFVYPWPWRIHL
jgi:hypothetical protein